MPMQDIRAETLAKAFINGWVARFGARLYLTTVRGQQFESPLSVNLRPFSQLRESAQQHITPYSKKLWKGFTVPSKHHCEDKRQKLAGLTHLHLFLSFYAQL